MTNSSLNHPKPQINNNLKAVDRCRVALDAIASHFLPKKPTFLLLFFLEQKTRAKYHSGLELSQLLDRTFRDYQSEINGDLY